ncbi:MAG: DegV family EDD domain-containing protein [Ruminococcaceae bacterium]|nr:DegV family EDD domain-containing protein [Oscillospiraceae bacterium]
MIWNIVSDSSCDLRTCDFNSESIRFQLVSLRIQVGEREFMDNDDLCVPEMLAAMSQESSAASSACPSPGDFAKAFEAGDCTLCFTISANLSGTYNAAVMAREMVLEEHPEKKICIIDSKATAGAMVLLIRKTKEIIEANPEVDFEELCGMLRIYQASLRTCFTLESFDNLIKNGRMRPLVGTLLHSLGIHVTAVASPQGTIQVVGKARGEVKTYKALAKIMAESKDCTGAEVVISHCENATGAQKLKEQILETLPVRSVDILSCRGLTSFYAMEKGLIIGY